MAVFTKEYENIYLIFVLAIYKKLHNMRVPYDA